MDTELPNNSNTGKRMEEKWWQGVFKLLLFHFLVLWYGHGT